MKPEVERGLLDQIERARRGAPVAFPVGPAEHGDRVARSDFEAERRGVLAPAFWPVCRVGDVTEVGAMRTLELAGHRIVLVRGADGELRAFRNLCPHRGAVLVRCAAARGERITCPYHGFTFDLAGALVGVSDAGSFGAALDDVALSAVQLETAHGWHWLRPGERAEPVEDFLGQRLTGDLANWDLASLERKHVAEERGEFNWKLGVEAFLESLHVPSIHSRTAHPLIDFRATAFEDLEPHSVMATPFRAPNAYRADGPLGDAALEAGVPNFPGLNRLQLESNLSYLVFPATILNFLPNHVTVFTLFPVDEATTRFVWELFGSPSASPAAERYHESVAAGYAQLVREDLENLAWIQRGVSDPAARPPILSRHEHRIRAFRAAVARRTTG